MTRVGEELRRHPRLYWMVEDIRRHVGQYIFVSRAEQTDFDCHRFITGVFAGAQAPTG